MAREPKTVLIWTPGEIHTEVRAQRKAVIGSRKISLPWSGFQAGEFLSRLAERGDTDKSGNQICMVSNDGNSLLVSNDWLANLTEPEALALDLPPSTVLTLSLQSKGTMANPEFYVETKFTDMASRPKRATRVGAFLKAGEKLSRLPFPLFDVACYAEKLSYPIADEAERYRLVTELTELLPSAFGEHFAADQFLENLQLQYASSVSLHLTQTGRDFDFDPILFGRNHSEDDEGLLNEETDALLAPVDQQTFLQQWKSGNPDRPACVLGKDRFVYIDPSLRPVMQEIDRAKKAPPEEKQDFALNPRKYFREILGNRDDIDEQIETLFIETEQYSERVLGADIWRKQVLPWIKPKPNSWLPESFGLKVGDKTVKVEPSQATELHSNLIAAQENAQTEIVFNNTRIPVSTESIKAAGDLVEVAEEISKLPPAFKESAIDFDHDTTFPSADDNEAAQPVREKIERYFLVVSENFETLDYDAGSLETADFLTNIQVPKAVVSTLKPHQIDGLKWLANCQHTGARGALLADDMGLGKTLQALTALCWRHENTRSESFKKQPTLLIAPTALIQNWLNEIEIHLAPGIFSDVAVVAGKGIGTYKAKGTSELTDKGALDVKALAEADIVLTTYETMRDYHISFARIPFGVIVFDEIQKAKNPSSQMTRAAKSLNGSFKIGLTGTPVENRLQDLWSIVDILWPGYLGSSKEFAIKYKEDNYEALQELRQILEKGKSEQNLPLMVRRMKADQLEGLPSKSIHTIPIEMPKEQAEAYMRVVLNAKQNSTIGNSGVLQILHHLRGISLSPDDPENYDPSANPQTYIERSARLKATFQVLDDIAQKGEKAIIFLETIAMQSWLAGVIKERYRLDHRPGIINGAIAGVKRQAIVDEFQSGKPGFDALVLSPKAAGVGLTITAANHVIHLSRWWNPAVEDQATDRVYRIGQDKPVHVYLPQAIHPNEHLKESSFDLRVQALINRKRKLAGELIVASEAGSDELSTLFSEIISSNDDEETIDRPPHAEEHGTLSESAHQIAPTTNANSGAARTSTRSSARQETFIAFVGAGPRPNNEALGFLEYGNLKELWIEDPYLFSEKDIRAAIQFMQQGVLENVKGDLRLRVRALDPNCDRIRRFSNHSPQALFAALHKATADRIPGNLKFERDLDLRPSKSLHNRQITFVMEDPTQENDLVYAWSLPMGLLQWMDEDMAIGQVSAMRIDAPYWISKM